MSKKPTAQRAEKNYAVVIIEFAGTLKSPGKGYITGASVMGHSIPKGFTEKATDREVERILESIWK